MQGDVADDGVVELGNPGAEGVGVAEEGSGGIAEADRVAVMEVGGLRQPLAWHRSAARSLAER